jgi:hypothetical protein
MNKKIILSLLIFFLVFFALGIPYIHWWFCGSDDFLGLFQGHQTKTWDNLFYYFINGDIHQGMGPTNYIHSTENPTFFGVYYRPLYLVYLGLQYWLFGFNAHFYLLTNVFFHAINTVILFNIFLWFIDLYPAFLVALTFAFHPQIAYRFGAIVNLHYYINVMLILLIMLFFKKYLDTEKIIYNLLACLLFAVSLFTRETTIVLPVIIFFGAYLYNRSYGSIPRQSSGLPRTNSEQNQAADFRSSRVICFANRIEGYERQSFLQNFFHALKQTSGIILVAISFLVLRAFLYPIKFSQTATTFNPLSWLINKFPEFQVITYDFLGLSWLPWGHKLIRGSLVVTLFSILLWLFIKNTKKIYILYFIFSMTLMFWLILFGGYCPRYFYEAQPFALMALIFLFKFYDGDFGVFKKIGLVLLTLLVVFYIEFAIENFLKRERKMNVHKNAIEELLKNPTIKNSSLCFLGYPSDGFGDQFSSLLWALLNNPNIKLYFDPSTMIVQADSNIVQTNTWRNIISNEFSENFVDIQPVNGGFRFISLNPNKVFFESTETGCSLGKKIINKKEKIKNEIVVTDFTLLIDQKYLDEKPLFIKWNYRTKTFVILN